MQRSTASLSPPATTWRLAAQRPSPKLSFQLLSLSSKLMYRSPCTDVSCVRRAVRDAFIAHSFGCRDRQKPVLVQRDSPWQSFIASEVSKGSWRASIYLSTNASPQAQNSESRSIP